MRPTPDRLKIVSVKTAPPNKPPNDKPITVASGNNALRKACFKIIAEMEEARAFKESRAVEIQDERKNFFRIGVKNIRSKALNLLIADKIVIKTNSGKYYLDKEKLDQAKSSIDK